MNVSGTNIVKSIIVGYFGNVYIIDYIEVTVDFDFAFGDILNITSNGGEVFYSKILFYMLLLIIEKDKK